MHQFDCEILTRAFADAVKANPLFLPNAEQVRVCAVEARRQKAIDDKRLSDERDNETEVETEYPCISPDNPGYEMAMRWQEESRKLGIGPNDMVPAEIARRRCREAMALVGSSAK